MNERIIDLADQAGVMSSLDLIDHETGDKVRLFTFKEEDMNKFVSLLIEECSLKMKTMKYHNFDTDDYPRLLKKHFGVGV